MSSGFRYMDSSSSRCYSCEARAEAAARAARERRHQAVHQVPVLRQQETHLEPKTVPVQKQSTLFDSQHRNARSVERRSASLTAAAGRCAALGFSLEGRCGQASVDRPTGRRRLFVQRFSIGWTPDEVFLVGRSSGRPRCVSMPITWNGSRDTRGRDSLQGSAMTGHSCRDSKTSECRPLADSGERRGGYVRVAPKRRCPACVNATAPTDQNGMPTRT